MHPNHLKSDTRLSTALARRAILVVAIALATVASVASTVALAVAPRNLTSSDRVAADYAVHTSGHCQREAKLVARALRRSSTRVDVDGDARLDKVAVATDQGAGRRCRAFVAVDLRRGPTYSTRLHRSAVPPRGLEAEIVGLPDLGDDPGAEIVVDTHRSADATLAQLFTFTRSGLARIALPAFEDGNFVVEGGGVSFPRGAGCTSAGALRLSMATLDGHRYEVTRHTYRLYGDSLELGSPAMVTRWVRDDRLAVRFPEFADPHWAACTGPVA